MPIHMFGARVALAASVPGTFELLVQGLATPSTLPRTILDVDVDVGVSVGVGVGRPVAGPSAVTGDRIQRRWATPSTAARVLVGGHDAVFPHSAARSAVNMRR